MGNALSEYKLGQGCMGIGGEFTRDVNNDVDHISALRLGVDLGLKFLDTAEIYGGGHSEELIGRAIKGIRSKVFIASKFSPENSSYKNVLEAAERSLTRLKTDYLDLYQVHWPNPKIPVCETMAALEKLVLDGKILNIGVSNFSKLQMIEAQQCLVRTKIISNQVEYNLFDRFVENDIYPHCISNNSTLIAYSPLEKGRIASDPKVAGLLKELAAKYEKTISQIALNWVISKEGVLAIPKSTNPSHIRQNAEALNFVLADTDQASLDSASKAVPLQVSVKDIHVSSQGEGNRKVYQMLSEALENNLGLSPSPSELAELINNGEPIKPVRLRANDSDTDYKYELVEGRLRYWAWVIAFGDSKPIPAYVRYS